jgi:hypothetical protein
MILLTLAKRPHECRVELNGVDITPVLTGIDIRAHMGTAITSITLTLLDDVTVIGDAGHFEFHKPGTPRWEPEP